MRSILTSVLKPCLSIIITSYRLENLKDVCQLLDSIKAQTYENIETVFVAERSLELFARIQRYVSKNKIQNASIIYNYGETGATNARNLGIRSAKGDALAFVDDDVVLFPDWAEELMNAYQDQSIVGVTGPIFPLWEDESMDWFPREMEWMLGCTGWLDLKTETVVRSVNGPNASFRRKALDLAGPYSSSLGPTADRPEWNALAEETELSLRVSRKTGKCIIFNPRARVYHRVTKRKLGLSFILQRSYQVGHTKRMLRKLYYTTDMRGNLLNTENQLLRRILGRLPQLVTGNFDSPSKSLAEVLACHRVSILRCTWLLFLLGGIMGVTIIGGSEVNQSL